MDKNIALPAQTNPSDQAQAIPECNRCYMVAVDYPTFKELFTAQQTPYLRKLGIACSIAFIAFAAFGIMMLVNAPSLENLGIALLFTALAIFGVRMAVKPFVFMGSREGIVQSWFEDHGAAFADCTPVEDLTVTYSISLTEFGFVEQTPRGRKAIPWFALSGKCISGKRADFYTAADGKNSSVAYNLLGINWMLRDEHALDVLVVPRDVATPQLNDALAKIIREACDKFRAVSPSSEECLAIRSWVTQS